MTGDSPRTIQAVNGFYFFLRQLHLDARCECVEEYELNSHSEWQFVGAVNVPTRSFSFSRDVVPTIGAEMNGLESDQARAT